MRRGKIVCTGGRDYEDYKMVEDILRLLDPGQIFVGDCPTGLDSMVRLWAHRKHDTQLLRVFQADWAALGRSAGPIRNRVMLEAAGPDSIVLAFKGGRGTADCVRQALGKSMIVLEVK